MRTVSSLIFIATFPLAACTSLPAMHSTETYSKMICSEINTEIAAVEAHKANSEDNAGFGFLDVLGGLTGVLAASSGRSDLLQQQSQVSASIEQGHAEGKASAEAHANRLELLNKVRTIRKCI